VTSGGGREVVFEFLGQRFVFRSSVTEEEVEEVLRYLEEKKKEIENLKKLPAFKLAVWLLMQVAYDYIKLKKEKEQLEEGLKAQAARLSEFLKEQTQSLGCA